MSSVATGLSNCLNCGADLHGAFCAACGQKATPPNPTFHDFWHELSHELLHLDGRLFRSVTLLFRRPGFLTREHFAGRRANYAAPMRLFLTFSLVYFVLAVYAPLEMTSRMDPKRGRVLHTGGIDISGDLLKENTDLEVADWLHRAEHEWGPRVAFVMVPVFALFTAASTRRQKRHLPQHLYFALHCNAAWFGFLCVPAAFRVAHQSAAAVYAGYAADAAIVVYTTLAVHAVYGRSWFRSFLQTVWTVLGYISLLVITTVFLFVALYSLDQKRKAQAGELPHASGTEQASPTR